MDKEFEQAITALQKSRAKANYAMVGWLVAIAAIAIVFFIAAEQYASTGREINEVRRELVEVRSMIQRQLQTARTYSNEIKNLKDAISVLSESQGEIQKELYVAERFFQDIPLTPVERQIQKQAQSINRGKVGRGEGQSSSELILQGISQLGSKDSTKALQSFADAGRSNTEGSLGLAQWGTGRAYYQDRQFDRAIEAYTQIIDRNDSKIVSGVLLDRGRAWVRLGNFDRALEDYNRAIEMGDDLAVAYRRRGLVLLKVGNLDAAHNDFQQAANRAANEEDLASAVENISLILLQKGEWRKVLENSKMVEGIFPESEWNWGMRTIAATQSNMQKQADRAFMRWQNAGGSNESALASYLSEDLWKILQERLSNVATDE